jgi:hypothetical protein
MNVCEFCLNFTRAGECAVGLKIPKGMKCREFKPGLEKFCADPKDFVSRNQIVKMATHFGIGRSELRKVEIMAASIESTR